MPGRAPSYPTANRPAWPGAEIGGANAEICRSRGPFEPSWPGTTGAGDGGAMGIGAAGIVAILAGLAVVVGIVGWLRNFISDR